MILLASLSVHDEKEVYHIYHVIPQFERKPPFLDNIVVSFIPSCQKRPISDLGTGLEDESRVGILFL